MPDLHLPPNVLRKIAEALPLRDAARMRAVSKNARAVVSPVVRNRTKAAATAVGKARIAAHAKEFRRLLAGALRVARAWGARMDAVDISLRFRRWKAFDIDADLDDDDLTTVLIRTRGVKTTMAMTRYGRGVFSIFTESKSDHCQTKVNISRGGFSFGPVFDEAYDRSYVGCVALGIVLREEAARMDALKRI